MSADVINRIHTLARRDRANQGGFEVLDRYGNPFIDIEDNQNDDDSEWNDEMENDQ